MERAARLWLAPGGTWPRYATVYNYLLSCLANANFLVGLSDTKCSI